MAKGGPIVVGSMGPPCDTLDQPGNIDCNCRVEPHISSAMVNERMQEKQYRYFHVGIIHGFKGQRHAHRPNRLMTAQFTFTVYCDR